MKRWTVCLAILLAGLLCLSFAAAEARTGRLVIRMGENTLLPDRSGINIALYRIGKTEGSDVDWVMDDAFSDAEVLEAGDSEELARAADRVADKIRKSGYQPIAQGTTNRSGRLIFAGLIPGVYFGQMTGGPETVKVSMQHFIVTVPGIKSDTHSHTDPDAHSHTDPDADPDRADRKTHPGALQANHILYLLHRGNRRADTQIAPLGRGKIWRDVPGHPRIQGGYPGGQGDDARARHGIHRHLRAGTDEADR